MNLQPSSEAFNTQRWYGWVTLGLKVVIAMCVVTFAWFVIWTTAGLGGPFVEPRWQWVWGPGRYQHLLDALDAHKPSWTDSDAIAEMLLRPEERARTNWIMGLAPMTERHFLVTEKGDDGVSFALYPATRRNAEYWAVRRGRSRAGDDIPSPESRVRVPNDLSVGHHPVTFPGAFHSFDEILVVFSSCNRAIEPRTAGFGPTCLMIARPRTSDVEVMTLDWWNENPRFWPNSDIERLFRDPGTGRLFGDGSHLRPFVLKEDPRELEAWLR